MARAGDYAAVAIDIEHIDDHRQAAFLVESGVDRQWVDGREQCAPGDSPANAASAYAVGA